MAATTQRAIHQLALLLHVRKTVALTSAVLRDARVHWFPKFVFLASVGILLLAVLFPEVATDLVAAVAIPGLGGIFDILGIPVDGAVDWIAFAVATFNLLKLFPPDVVGEHYDRLFHSARRAA